jgi:hypothetical protein
MYLTFRNRGNVTLGHAVRNRVTIESLVKSLNFKVWGNLGERGCTAHHKTVMVHETGIAPTTLVLITGSQPALAISALCATSVQPLPSLFVIYTFLRYFNGRVTISRSRCNCTTVTLNRRNVMCATPDTDGMLQFNVTFLPFTAVYVFTRSDRSIL